MTKDELIAAIRLLTDYKGVTLGEIEKTLNMPQNCLSGMVNGSRNLSKKWHPLLEAYVDAKMKGATEIVIPIGEAKIPPALKEKIDENNIPENKAKILKKRKNLTPLPSEQERKSPPPGLTKSEQIRWHRENNQTLQ